MRKRLGGGQPSADLRTFGPTPRLYFIGTLAPEALAAAAFGGRFKIRGGREVSPTLPIGRAGRMDEVTARLEASPLLDGTDARDLRSRA